MPNGISQLIKIGTEQIKQTAIISTPEEIQKRSEERKKNLEEYKILHKDYEELKRNAREDASIAQAIVLSGFAIFIGLSISIHSGFLVVPLAKSVISTNFM
jgi:hypothetical protein